MNPQQESTFESTPPAGKDELNSPYICSKYLLTIFDDMNSRRDSRSITLKSVSLPDLIAHLTSHEFLDYEILTDFFLSYRLFTTKEDILELLFTRLVWAISYKSTHSDEIGRDVTVRTFVVLRHWVLNFFPDDFLISIEFRTKFADGFNKLFNWDLIQTDDSVKLIFVQLKKCWIRECCLYWKDQFEDEISLSKPLLSGGQFAIDQIILPDASQKRLTLLSYYRDQIAPVLSGTDIPKSRSTNSAGRIIKGGISLSHDVEVKLSTPTPPSSSPVKSHILKSKKSFKSLRTLKPRKSLKSLKSILDSWRSAPRVPKVPSLYLTPPQSASSSVISRERATRFPKFFSSLVSALDMNERQLNTPRSSKESTRTVMKPTETIVRIDILSARVIEELDRILKNQLEQEEYVEPVADFKVDPHYRSGSPTKKFRMNDYRMNSGEHQQLENRVSMIDNLEIQNNLSCITRPLKRSRQHSDLTSVIDLNEPVTPAATADDLKVDKLRLEDEGEIHDKVRKSYMSSDSTASYVSYDSDMSNDGDDDDEDTLTIRKLGPGLRRREELGNLREAAENVKRVSRHQNTNDAYGFVFPRRKSLSAVPSVLLDPSSKTNNRMSNHILIPYSGVDAEVAACLAAIPDDDGDTNDDAIRIALEKLEGTYRRRSKKSVKSLPKDNSEAGISVLSNDSLTIQPQYSNDDSQLFNQAFQTEYVPLNPIVSGGKDAKSIKSFGSIKQLKITKTRPNAVELPSKIPSESSDLYESPRPSLIFQEHFPEKERSSSLKLEENHPLSVQATITQGNHTPFILNYTSVSLSKQLTLIEKDALAQVDWQELIQLQWNGQDLKPIQSWLSFLVERNIRGVEVVISRFNLAVNWIKSEILLTWSLGERIQTITKFIHIASYCRNVLQNYSTMMQIVLALSSDVIQRLTTTWKGINKIDIQTYESMLELVSPFKNFSNLRNEINCLNYKQGCIPFVGVYLTDLVGNNERPSFVDDNKQLINFEKFKTASSIVKSLIQCIEWSRNYDVLDDKLEQDRDLLAKCLYIHSLTVEEMVECFKYLNEPVT